MENSQYTEDTEEQIAAFEEEFSPLRAGYLERTLLPEQKRRVHKLSDILTHYYTHVKIWETVGDYTKAMIWAAEPFSMFAHRMSVEIRILGSRQPELFQKN